MEVNLLTARLLSVFRNVIFLYFAIITIVNDGIGIQKESLWSET